MNAIFQLKEKAVIKQLIESSASISVQRYLNQLTAKKVRGGARFRRKFDSKVERDWAWGEMLNVIVSSRFRRSICQ